jgi:uncharacterized damage-inducible protein DinB
MKKRYEMWLRMQEKLRDASNDFMDVAQRLDPKLRKKENVCGQWSANEVVAHIAGWEREVIRCFRMFLLDPTQDDTYDVNSFNEHSVASRKHLSWDELIAELTAAQEELGEVNASLGPDDLTRENRFLEWTVVLVRHYQHHMNQIKELTRA